MRSVTPVTRSIAVAAAIALTGFGAAPALADPGAGKGSSSGGAATSQGAGSGSNGDDAGTPSSASTGGPGDAAGKDGSKAGGGKGTGGPASGGDQGGSQPKPGGGKPSGGNQGSPATGNGGNQGGGKQGGGKQGGGKGGDPAGNNGTVKIAHLGEDDGTPNNTPHPGCRFQIEWYGFDAGTYTSTVSFTPHAPTSDVTIGGTEPSSVTFTGNDAASGAGTDTGLDKVQGYTLTFSGGAPHPKQGYHVKVTVTTPHSRGNDTKTKVFWVQPCTGSAAPGSTAPGSTPGVSPSETATLPADGEESSHSLSPSGVLGASASASGGENLDNGEGGAEAGVLGTSASADGDEDGGEDGREDGAADGAAVPTSVDAGGSGNPVLDFVSSPVPLALIGLGLALGALVLLRRRQGA